MQRGGEQGEQKRAEEARFGLHWNPLYIDLGEPEGGQGGQGGRGIGTLTFVSVTSIPADPGTDENPHVYL